LNKKPAGLYVMLAASLLSIPLNGKVVSGYTVTMTSGLLQVLLSWLITRKQIHFGLGNTKSSAAAAQGPAGVAATPATVARPAVTNPSPQSYAPATAVPQEELHPAENIPATGYAFLTFFMTGTTLGKCEMHIKYVYENGGLLLQRLPGMGTAATQEKLEQMEKAWEMLAGGKESNVPLPEQTLYNRTLIVDEKAGAPVHAPYTGSIEKQLDLFAQLRRGEAEYSLLFSASAQVSEGAAKLRTLWNALCRDAGRQAEACAAAAKPDRTPEEMETVELP
jgi:hypothetical protein